MSSPTKRIRALFSGQWVWVLTTLWIGLVLAKALVFTRGSVVTAVSMLGGNNFLPAAISAGLELIVIGLCMVSVLGTLIVFRGADLRLSRFDRAAALVSVFAALWLLVLTVPLAFVLIVVVLSGLNVAVQTIVLRRYRRRPLPEIRPSGTIRRSQTRVLIALAGGGLLIFIATSGTWVPAERVTIAGESSTVFVLNADDHWLTFVNEETRQLEIANIGDVEAREICWLRKSVVELDPQWLFPALQAPRTLMQRC